MLALFLQGKADGNVSAYNEKGERKEIERHCRVGLLSYDEAERGIQLSGELL